MVHARSRRGARKGCVHPLFADASSMTPIISVRRRNWKRRRLGGAAVDGSVCMAALSRTAGSRSKDSHRPDALRLANFAGPAARGSTRTFDRPI